MQNTTFDKLRLELSVQAKNGVDFITAATIIWLGIAYIWTLPHRFLCYSFIHGFVSDRFGCAADNFL